MNANWAGREDELNKLLREEALANDGILTLGRLAALGLSKGMVQTRRGSGRLVPVLKGAFALPGSKLRFRGRLRAALGSVSSSVVVSHASALALHGLVGDPGKVHLVGEGGLFHEPGRWGNREFGIEVIRHQTRWLPDEHLTLVDGIRVTTVERALRDYAASASPSEITRALTKGEQERAFCWSKLRSIVQASNGQKGLGMLLEQIEEWDPVFADAASDPEIDFLRMLRHRGLPLPDVNEKLGSYIPDFLWKHLRLAVELDPYGTHKGKAAHLRDHRKGIELEVQGLRVIRFVLEDLYLHEDRTASELLTVMRQQAKTLGCSVIPERSNPSSEG